MYKEFNDNEILYMINDSDDYLELMLEKYKPLINKLCKKYSKVGEIVGLEYNDLIQIANILKKRETSVLSRRDNLRFCDKL